MKPERWEQVERLYHDALEREPEARADFLDEACAGDAELRREVAALLAYDERAASFIEAPALEVAARALASDPKAGGRTEPSADLKVGCRVGAYQLLSPLGEGGMGEVHLALDTRLGRKAALKLLPAHMTAQDERVRRFRREALTASSLNHPNILTVYEIGEWEGRDFIATEYVEGVTLRQKTARSRIPLREALDVATQITAALVAAHKAGVVHRDIKPENVMIREDGIVKVLDFGLAKMTERPTVQPAADSAEAATRALVNTSPGMVMGTVSYMSPEQARGREVDARTDIFSLGVVLYEMLTGSLPFAGETASDVIAAILKTEPVPPGRLNQEVLGELERIVGKALAKEREQRYQAAEDLLVELRRLMKQTELQTEGGRAASTGTSEGEKATRDHAARPTSSAEYVVGEIRKHKIGLVAALSVLLLAGAGLSSRFFAGRSPAPAPIESVAVLPFVNASGNSDVEYLSDGMTETLINSLSQLPGLSVKARSSVFRYKGREVEPQTIAAELSVQAVLSGRVVQRGDDLTLYLSLVDARNGNQLWGEQYNRKLADLLALETEIARDVSQKLRARLSGAEERRVAKTYTANPEAHRLYLKGRYHVLKLTLSEIQTGISYFQQAIVVDPSYALAYVGLADAYRSALAGDMPPTELLPKAKAAAQKAVELDDTLADAHAELGFIIFWYDWDWAAAERQFKRALELDPEGADTHLFYAHLLSNTGRHAEALAEAKRARELDPLNLRINALEGQFLLHAGRADAALARLQKTLEIDPNYYLALLFASSAYTEKGMYAEAVAAARKAIEVSGASNTHPMGFLGYALAKSGKGAEARAVLEGMLRASTERYVAPYNIALIYHGLGERDETLAWLERSYAQRDQRITFLKVEPKWNNLRPDPRFQDLLRRVGLTP